jgi:hypothetical protein
MEHARWHYNLIHWITVVLVAGMLPLSCIIHCHVHAVPVNISAHTLFVCHPSTTINADSPQHLHAQTIMLRATHEFAILLSLIIMSQLLRSSVTQLQYTYTCWHPSPITPPPRGRMRNSQ